MEELKLSTKKTNVSGIPADFSKVEEVNQLIKAIPDLDILINNAGIFEPISFVDIPDQDWFRLFEVNVMSGIRLSRHYFPVEEKLGKDNLYISESAVFIRRNDTHVDQDSPDCCQSRSVGVTKGTGLTVNTICRTDQVKGAGVFIGEVSKKEIFLRRVEKNFSNHGLLLCFSVASVEGPLRVYVPVRWHHAQWARSGGSGL